MKPRRPTDPRKRPKQARAQATVEAILAATAHILVHEGVAAASTNRVAAKAGVSIGSLYQYFPSKEALLAALLERHVATMQAVVQVTLAASTAATPRQAVRAMVRAMLEAHAAEPALHRVLMEEAPKLGPLERVEALDRWFEDFAKAALTAQRRRLRPRDLDVAAFVLVQTMEALAHAAVLHRPDMLRRPAFVDEVTELVVRYLLAAPSADRRRRASVLSPRFADRIGPSMREPD